MTFTQVVPTMFSRLLKLPEDVRRAADGSSLEAIVHAAAPCPVPVKEQMIEWFGPIIYEYYGATEANGITFCTTKEWLAHRGTVGKAILGEVVIMDEDLNECPTGTPGTVWFRGATNFQYYNDPTKTAESRIGDGNTSTVGDVGYLDDEGYLYLTDRKSYMIISGGVNIYPQETENLLITHPKVLDAAVIGVPNEDLGEEVKGVVQPAAGVEPGPELERELIALCRENLAHFKCPRTIDFVDELPRLPTGSCTSGSDALAGHTTASAGRGGSGHVPTPAPDTAPTLLWSSAACFAGNDQLPRPRATVLVRTPQCGQAEPQPVGAPTNPRHGAAWEAG